MLLKKLLLLQHKQLQLHLKQRVLPKKQPKKQKVAPPCDIKKWALWSADRSALTKVRKALKIPNGNWNHEEAVSESILTVAQTLEKDWTFRQKQENPNRLPMKTYGIHCFLAWAPIATENS